MNRRIVIGALAALLFVTGAVLSLIRGETLMAVVFGLGGLAFIVCGARRAKFLAGKR